MSVIQPFKPGTKITLIQSPQERRYHAKMAQAEANIRRFDSSGRDNPRRNYWWGQRRRWETKLHPWLRQPIRLLDFKLERESPDHLLDLTATKEQREACDTAIGPILKS